MVLNESLNFVDLPNWSKIAVVFVCYCGTNTLSIKVEYLDKSVLIIA